MIRLRQLWFQINASYWFLPALFALGAFALAQGCVYLDRSGVAETLNSIQALSPAPPQGASNMLTVLAGSMIGVASTVFSITIAAVAYASGAYGPRLLTNFMEDRGNQFSLASFIGTFVYAITVLRTVRAENEAASGAQDAIATTLPGFVPQLSLLVGFGLMMVAVGVLVFFLHHIPASIRINSVLEGIGRRLLREVEDRFPADGALAPERPKGGVKVPAQDVGYVQTIDFSRLAQKLAEWDARLVLEVSPEISSTPGPRSAGFAARNATRSGPPRSIAGLASAPPAPPRRTSSFPSTSWWRSHCGRCRPGSTTRSPQSPPYTGWERPPPS